MRRLTRTINIALIFMLIGMFLFSNISYGLRVPLNTWQNSRDNLKPEFTYYTRDEDGKLLKEPCGFPGHWVAEMKAPIKEDTNAGVQRMIKSFSLSMHSSGRQDVKKAKFTVVEVLPEEQKGILVSEKDFYIMSSEKFGIEVVIKASFLKKGISSQRAIFAKIAEKIPKQTDLIMPKTAKTGRKIKRIAIINPFYAGMGVKPTSLVLASLLKGAGYDVDIITPKPAYDINEIINEIKDKLEDVDVVCISLYDLDIDYVKLFTEALKKIKRDITIAVGGPSITIAPEHMFSHLPSADIFYRGEAEAGFVDILNDLRDLDFESASTHHGVSIHARNLYYFSNFISVNRMTIDQLNRGPFNFSFLNKNNIHGEFTFMTSLGCPYACIFCATGGGKAHRAMSPENVIEIACRYQERLEELKAEGAVIPDDAWKVGFSDDDFLKDPERAIKIFKLWRRAGLKLKIVTFQSTVQSFLTKPSTGEKRVDIELISRIASFKDDIFSDDFELQIGTDALIDPEIRRLNKGPYNENLIEDVMVELGKRGIMNQHDLILTNADTTLEDLIRTFLKAAIFELKYPHTFFQVNYAIMPHTTTSAVNKLVEESRDSLIKGERLNRIQGFREYDFGTGVITPANIPPNFFDFLKSYYVLHSIYIVGKRFLMISWLTGLSDKINQELNLSSKHPLIGIGSKMFSDRLRDDLLKFKMLEGKIKEPSEEARLFRNALVSLAFLEARLRKADLLDPKIVHTSL